MIDVEVHCRHIFLLKLFQNDPNRDGFGEKLGIDNIWGWEDPPPPPPPQLDCSNGDLSFGGEGQGKKKSKWGGDPSSP